MTSNVFQRRFGILPQAAPSQAEALYQNFKSKKEKLTTNNKKAVVERYGNAAAADKPDEALLLGQTESYVEYDASGVLERPMACFPAFPGPSCLVMQPASCSQLHS